ncbi:stimulated by retinoic acid gene 6 protein-like isoform X2 [Xenopus laevis]|uniref:Stimulated by retinoic acid gene 6 protein-like isoform X2 n=2 Tax=Xenopus laevis TaxID=8355 RepID=A0A1L8GTF9_XENLA|nr:stimulated by retinoic acid gene 6 protein-like isoform X2 [Xenopus laevis]OCT87125.1 hypothetical protein XELAEV_18020819mg [Xenopus laevis]
MMESATTSRLLVNANETTQSTADTCMKSIRMDLFVHVSLIPAVLITVLLSYVQRRASLLKTTDKLPLSKKFGIVVPVNFISSYSNRWSFGAACGATATTVFLLFFNEYSNYFNFTAPPWAKALVYLLSALEVAMDYYPFFACLSTENRILGSSLGFCYAVCWFCVQLADMFECQKITQASTILLLTPVPSLVCCLFLIGRFLHILVKTMLALRRPEEKQEHEEPLLPKHLTHYLNYLLKGFPEIDSKRCWLKQKIYTFDPSFKFPTRMIVTAVLCLICLYNFFLVDLFVSPKAVKGLEHWALITINLSYENRTIWVLNLLKDSWFYATFPAAFTSVIYILHLLSCYRKQMKKLYKGTSDISRQSKPPVILAASIRYTGNQIAYLLWGYFLLHILFFLISLMITFWFIIPIQEGRGIIILQGLGYTVLGIVIMVGVIVIQILASQFFFLQDKINPKDKSKPLAINNRRAFQNFSYFFMFYSAILGFGACLIRIMLNVFLGSWLLARIDRPLFPRGYEGADMGYSTWIGMLLVDFHHTNPVALSFCHLLLHDLSTSKQLKSTDALHDCKKKQRKIKWHLAYTLINNPVLILSRKQHNCSSSSLSLRQQMLERIRICAVHSHFHKQTLALADNDTEASTTESLDHYFC